MKNFIYIAALLLFVSVAVKATNDDDSNESDDAAPEKNPSSTESKAGEAIKTLLQEKITQKFKEAANEVKGVLVKQLGDSLKSAHEAFNPPKEKEVGKKIGGAVGAKASESKAGAAKVHQNKANRHRKNSGPQAAPNTDEAGMNSTKLFQDAPPNMQPNTSVIGINGSNLFPNDPLLPQSQPKPFLPPASRLPNRPHAASLAGAAGRKCPKHLHVKVRLRFNRNKLCLRNNVL